MVGRCGAAFKPLLQPINYGDVNGKDYLQQLHEVLYLSHLLFGQVKMVTTTFSGLYQLIFAIDMSKRLNGVN
jgi:hypothetical protein